MMLWASRDARAYERTTRTYTPSGIPASIADQISDTDGNGIPDSVENMTPAELRSTYKSMGNTTSMSDRSLVRATLDPT
jgi:hypothetical protein